MNPKSLLKRSKSDLPNVTVLLDKSNIEIRTIEHSRSNIFEIQQNTLITISDRNKSLTIKFNQGKDDTATGHSFSELIESAIYTVGRELVITNILLFERLWYQTELIQNVKDSVNLQKEFVNIVCT